MNRKQFMQTGVVSLGALAIPLGVMGQPVVQTPNFSLEQIKEFVFAAHKSLEETQAIIDKHPLLLNCTNQAKKGDFETALGGASHMGRKDIADMLVGRGARMDIFSMCFLGFTDMVKILIKAHPQLLKAPGPHGFTLLHHAQVGKHTEFAKWLQDQGLDKEWIKDAFG